jgi:tripartite-type tricarboxylate transporter receptor subunit TctC
VNLRHAMRLLGAAALLLAASLPVAAEDFYQGKTLTIVVGFSPGGGFDLNARMLARHIGAYIPGHPDVIVVNMPGAGSFVSLKHLDTNAVKDGTVIDIFNFGLINDSLLQPEKTRIDFRNYAWIGSIAEDFTACYVWRTAGVRNIAEMKKHGTIHYGRVGVGTSEDLNTKILMNIFGAPIQQVAGYPGSAEIRVAVERGELDGDCGAWSSIPEDWIKGGKIDTIARSGAGLPDDMAKDVPYFLDIAPDARAHRLVRFLLADSDVGRPFVASREVPADRIAILRAAFDATVKDPAFIADARKLRLPLSPRSGAEATKVIDEIYATPADIIAAARKIVAD